MKNARFAQLVLGMCLAALTACQETPPQQATKTPPNYLQESETAKSQRMEWWRNARFGMFIHWGPSSVWAGEWNGKRPRRFSEWIMSDAQIPIADYETLADDFNPTAFDAEEWVSVAKAAGMKYIVLTSKHHDGFAMWDSEHSEWDMGSTAFKRDVIKELHAACEKAGIRLGLYYSVMDWHNLDAQGYFEPNYNNFPHDDSLRANPNFRQYLDRKMKPQLKELLTNYGEIAVIWFDGEWINEYTSDMGKEIYQFVREQQPKVIINNRVDKGRQGMTGMDKEGNFAGDFGTPEQEIPETGLPGIDWETCQTLNDSWGYSKFDSNWKSDSTMICQLVDIASKGGNLLLNVGPTAEGVIPEPSVQVLKGMGQWMDINGESIYGTSASPIEAPEWGRITQKEGVLYLHVFHWPEVGKLTADLEGDFAKASLLANGEELPLSQSEGHLELSLPTTAPDAVCSVVKLEKR